MEKEIYDLDKNKEHLVRVGRLFYDQLKKNPRRTMANYKLRFVEKNGRYLMTADDIFINITKTSGASKAYEIMGLMIGMMNVFSFHGEAMTIAYINKHLDDFSAAEGAKLECKKGCSFCCYQSVAISGHEARILSRFEPVNKGPGCRFLSEGSCTVYSERPMKCRNYNHTGSPASEQCAKGTMQTTPVFLAVAMTAAMNLFQFRFMEDWALLNKD